MLFFILSFAGFAQDCEMPPLTPSNSVVIGTPTIDSNPMNLTGLESIYAYDNNNNCVGSGTFISASGVTYFSIELRGDDAATETDEGLISGEIYNLRMFQSEVEYNLAEDFVFTNTNGAPDSNYPFDAVYNFELAEVLPVVFKYFEVSCESSQTTLEWVTDTEINVRGFEVEHSTDGQSFSPIDWAETEGAGLYKTIHNSNAGGYYRLRVYDYDGKETFSEVQFCKTHSEGNILVYPNPTSENATLRIEETIVNAFVEIFNAQGQRCKLLEIPQDAISIDLPVSNLANGLYQIKVETMSGNYIIPLLKIDW